MLAPIWVTSFPHCIYIYMCVCACVYVCEYIYVRVYIYIYIYICACVYIYIYMCVCMCCGKLFGGCVWVCMSCCTHIQEDCRCTSHPGIAGREYWRAGEGTASAGTHESICHRPQLSHAANQISCACISLRPPRLIGFHLVWRRVAPTEVLAYMYLCMYMCVYYVYKCICAYITYIYIYVCVYYVYIHVHTHPWASLAVFTLWWRPLTRKTEIQCRK